VIYEIMRTSDAVTSAGGVTMSLAGLSLLYAAVAVTLILLSRRLAGGVAGPDPAAGARDLDAAHG
jgi:cytochrome bd-type quinol oxidase subunit 1